MVGFDATEVKKRYAAMSTEDLVSVAYIEEGYLPEAKAIALRELDKRGVPEGRDGLIARVRRESAERQEEIEQARFVADEITRKQVDRFKMWFFLALLVFAVLYALWVS